MFIDIRKNIITRRHKDIIEVSCDIQNTPKLIGLKCKISLDILGEQFILFTLEFLLIYNKESLFVFPISFDVTYVAKTKENELLVLA